MEPSDKQLFWMYEKMIEIRRYEEMMAKVYLEGKLPPKIQKGLAFDIGAGPVPGEMHLAAGQEPVAVGTCVHLGLEDTVVGAHRSHHFAIAKGVPLNEMTAEMFGKVTGLCRGKGGHMHLFHPPTKFSCSGIVGAGIPQACGAALANQKRGNKHVALAFFGEGAANQGAFHESLNLAALWKLPVIFICEDNNYGISVPKAVSTSVPTNDIRAIAYDMPGVLVQNNDTIGVFKAAAEAVERARSGRGPTLIEIQTHRYLGHFQGDAEVYRDKKEVSELKKSDPIPRLGEVLRSRGLINEKSEQELLASIDERIHQAFDFARESPYPNAEDALLHVFAD